MVEVLSAVSGESIAVLEDEELAGAPVNALKQRLAQKHGIPRFRLRILQCNCPPDDNQTLIGDQTLTSHEIPMSNEQRTETPLCAAEPSPEVSIAYRYW